MVSTRFLVLLAFFMLSASASMAQSEFEVSEPRFTLEGNILLIRYDILNSKESELFFVQIDILDPQNKPVQARALSGDIGAGVKGGTEKTIIWDLDKDQIEITGEIKVTIRARLEPSMGAVDYPNFSRSSLILQSLAVPGLGMSRLTGKPHWIRGALAYGCIAGSVVLNRQAVNSYQLFLNDETTAGSRQYLDQAQAQDQLSGILAYSALGIWVVDIVWTMLGTRDMQKGIQPMARIDPLSGAPLAGITYKF